MKPILIIGTDPGDTTGVALLQCIERDPVVLLWDEINLATLGGQRRLNAFMDEALALGKVHGLAMEKPRHSYIPDRNKTRGMNFKEAIAISANISIGQGCRRGEIRARAIDRDIPVLGTITSDQVKAAMASSLRASKEQVAQAVKLRFGVDLPEHAADAVAIAFAVLRRDYALLHKRAQRPR